MKSNFLDLDYTAKQKVTRRDRFLTDIGAIKPWAALEAEIDSHYAGGGGERLPIGLGRMVRMYIAQQ